MINFKSFSGVITQINNFFTGNEQEAGCYKLITVQSSDGNIVNFVIEPNTYVVDHEILSVGDQVVGYYDGLAPVPLIYPPQYRAIVMAEIMPLENVKVDFFNEDLISSDGSLQLNMSPFTPAFLENGQPFEASIQNRDLIVLYGPSTKSIPAQTTPYEVIVLCR